MKKKKKLDRFALNKSTIANLNLIVGGLKDQSKTCTGTDLCRTNHTLCDVDEGGGSWCCTQTCNCGDPSIPSCPGHSCQPECGDPI